MTPLAIILLVYLLGILALSLYAGRRVHNEEDYLVAGRRLPLSLAWATLLATWFGAATMMGAAGAARTHGLRGTLLDPFASGAALIVAGMFFAPPLWNMRLLTLSDFYARRFGPKSEILASVILVPGYFGWIAAQYLALAALAHTFFGIDATAGVLVAAGIVLLYTLIGGMWSVTLTDALQISVVLVTLIVLAVEVFSKLGGGSLTGGLEALARRTIPEHLTLLPEAGAAAMLGWIAVWGSGVLGNIPGQDLMQRVFASKDARTASRACVLAGVVYLGFGLLPVGMGLASQHLLPGELDDPEQVLAVLARRNFTGAMIVVFVVSLVSIIVSTATSAVLSPAAILGHNLLGRLRLFRGRSLFVDRLSVALVTAGAVATAFSGRTILELLELSLSIGVATLFVPLVFGLFGRPRGERAALWAMGLGGGVWLARELLELALLPAPESFQGHYADYVAATLAAEHAGLLLARGTYLFAVVPSAISGGLASLGGYLLGHWFAVGDSSPGRADKSATTNSRGWHRGGAE